ncbi:MAG: TonB-dependent receptor [Saprospiraceae bacterium]|nr:TonB-dependent receptor [Saprospiraceae bacterium]
MHTISGVVKNQSNGETLIGANIYLADGVTGTITNEYGFYSLTLPSDSIEVTFSYLGLISVSHSLYLTVDTILNVELDDGLFIEEITVNANSNQEKVNSTQMGMDEITVKEAKEIAAIFGEVDVIKVLQLKPGVQSGSEGSSGLFIRGGGADQNHFILDEAPVYNPSHLFGFFSTFNADAIKNVKLYKAGFPSEFGGKLSSVIDIRMREGNRKKFNVTGGLGLISSRLTVEGPIVKDKGSFILSGRRTYVDVFTAAFNEGNKDNEDWVQIPNYSFYDINLKANYDLGDKDRLFLSGYFGRDVFLYKADDINFNFEWGNANATLRWNHIVSSKLFVNTSFTFSDYLYDINNTFDEFDLRLGSGIRDFNLKTDFSWFPSSKHKIKFGLNSIYHRFSVGRFSAGNGTNLNFEAGSEFHAGEFAAYFSDDWAISSKVKLLTGLRLSGFYNEGQFYWAAEPRFALKYSVHQNVSLKANYSRMAQYIHLVSTSGASLPTDVWYPSNERVKPQFSDLVSAGVSIALGKDFYISGEGYYKWMHNQIDFRDGANLIVNDELDKEFIFGKGYSYGGEIYLEKKNGMIRGWIGYTLSWTWREFELVNDGIPYHPRHDRRHDISIVVMWDIPWARKKFPLTLSATWVYGTGNATSLPTGRYIMSGIIGQNPYQFVPLYTERGSFRMPAYHRLDLGLVWKLFPQSKKRFKSDLTISVYNVYNRRNAFFMYIDAVYADGGNGFNSTQLPEKFEAKTVSLFPIIPTITWNFKW